MRARRCATTTIDIALLLSVKNNAPSITIITPGINPTQDSARIGELRQVLSDAIGQGGPVIQQESIYGTGSGGFFDAFAPALVGFVVFFLVFILTGISFLRERIGGTLERLLATPVRRSEIVSATAWASGSSRRSRWRWCSCSCSERSMSTRSGHCQRSTWALGVPIAGSPVLAFVITLLLALCAVNLGIFLSTFARTEFQIIQFIPLVIVPQAFLSGIVFPVDQLPGLLEPIARVLPMTYGIDGLREVLIKGSGLDSGSVQLDIVVLAGIALVLAVAATLTIRREVA